MLRRLTRTEPVRVYLYGVGAALLLLAGAADVVDVELAGPALALLGALLGVPAVETARSRVSPVPRPVALDARHGAGVQQLGQADPVVPGERVEVERLPRRDPEQPTREAAPTDPEDRREV